MITAAVVMQNLLWLIAAGSAAFFLLLCVGIGVDHLPHRHRPAPVKQPTTARSVSWAFDPAAAWPVRRRAPRHRAGGHRG
ncbi:MAG TPA: hypothetical protein VK545_10180 [Streptomyces sp.]|nr:hypothetical protein [Streptomyces sp.]